jgi:hypothetical protein
MSEYGNDKKSMQVLDPTDFQLSELEEFNKDFYTEHSETKNMSEEEVTKFREENSIKVFGKNAPNPIIKFEYGNFPGLFICETYT